MDDLTAKGMNVAVFMIILVAYLLFVNSLNFAQSSKLVLYLFGAIFLFSWIIYIIRTS